MVRSLTGTSAFRVFACPHCGETINTTMQRCSFCKRLIAPEQAALAADEMSCVSAACNQASLLNIAFAGEGVQIFIRLFIHSTSFGKAENLVILGEVGLAVMHWWIKYGKIQTTDSDYAPARKSVAAVTVAVVVAIPIVILMSFFMT